MTEFALSDKQILGFIGQFKGAEDTFLFGMCFWFAYILQSRFGGGEIIYDPISGHFMWAYEKKAYDVIGSHDLPEAYELWRSMKDKNDLQYYRILRDCVLKVSR